MRVLPVAFCDTCAALATTGQRLPVIMTADHDYPAAACCPHLLAEYQRRDVRQSDMFRAPEPAHTETLTGESLC